MSVIPVRASVAATCALVVLLTAACGRTDPNHDADPFNDDPASLGSVKLSERPPMEAIVREYRSFQNDLFARLGRTFGPRGWQTSEGMNGIISSGCGPDDPHWDVVGFPNMNFLGTYPAGQWHQVRDLVVAVGEKHGFTQTASLVDEPGNLDLIGHDPRYGGSYEFGMGKNTVFGMETGCHHWDHLPSPGR